MTKPKRKVLVAGGGTAGHVFPAIAVAQQLQRMDPSIEPVFVGTADRLEDRLVPEAGFRLHHIDAMSLPRKPSMKLLKLPGALRKVVRRCEEIIAEEEAVAAVTFGGYVSFPLDWACGRTNTPLVLHEQNAIPGVTNRIAARWASKVAVTFPGSADTFPRPERTVVTGNPVRAAILDLDVEEARARARAEHKLAPHMRTVLVFGGSQGARAINEAIVATHGLWSDPRRIQILHGAGAKLHAEAEAAWDAERQRGGAGPIVRCVDFITDMAAALSVADVVVCRAGATSIAELTALGLPSLLVPYPHATADHQTANGLALQRAGGAVVIADDALDGASIVSTIEPWLADDTARQRVSAAAKAFGRRDAATLVARQVLALIDGQDAA